MKDWWSNNHVFESLSDEPDSTRRTYLFLSLQLFQRNGSWKVTFPNQHVAFSDPRFRLLLSSQTGSGVGFVHWSKNAPYIQGEIIIFFFVFSFLLSPFQGFRWRISIWSRFTCVYSLACGFHHRFLGFSSLISTYVLVFISASRYFFKFG